jgi:hypothetical protein
MLICNIGNPQRTSTGEPPDGIQTYKNMTTKFYMSLEKPTPLLMPSPNLLELIKVKQTTRTSPCFLYTNS